MDTEDDRPAPDLEELEKELRDGGSTEQAEAQSPIEPVDGPSGNEQGAEGIQIPSRHARASRIPGDKSKRKTNREGSGTAKPCLRCSEIIGGSLQQEAFDRLGRAGRQLSTELQSGDRTEAYLRFRADIARNIHILIAARYFNSRDALAWIQGTDQMVGAPKIGKSSKKDPMTRLEEFLNGKDKEGVA